MSTEPTGSALLDLTQITDEDLENNALSAIKELAIAKKYLDELPYSQKIEYYKPNPGGQEDFMKSQAFERWLFGGNSSGKTEQGAVETVLFMLGVHPYRKIKTPTSGWAVSVDFPNSRDVAQTKIFNYLPSKYIKKWNADDRILVTTNDSDLTFKSCITGDTKVLMASGLWKRIDEICIGESVITNNTYGPGAFKNKVKKVKEIIKLKDKECVNIITRNGYEIKCTLDHKIYANGKFRKAEELKIGDKVVVYHKELFGKNKVEYWKPAILGSLISDGCLCTETILWSEPNKNSRDELLKYLPKDIRIVSVDKKGINFRISNPNGKNINPVKNYLKEVGLIGSKSNNKFIPACVFKFDKECLRIFLRHLFNGDGWIGKQRINYSTISEVLAKDLHLLLLNIGVKSCIREINHKDKIWESGNKKYNYIGSKSYSIDIGSSKEYFKFIQFIEYLPKYKLESNLRHRTSNGDIRNWDKKRTIKKIEKIGKHDVYDIVIDLPKTFYANGILVYDCDSGREKFQGARKHFIWFDEQPLKSIYKECKARIMPNVPLNIWGTMTPLFGYDWIYYDIYENQIPGKKECFNIPIDENIHLSEESKQQLKEAYIDEADISSRLYGQFQARMGLIYAKYINRKGENPTVIDFDKFDIKPHYPRVMCIDPHPRNPSAICIGAVMPNDDIIFYDEIYGVYTVKEMAEEFKKKKKPSDRFIRSLIDTSAATKDQITGTSVKDEFAKYGIYTTLVKKVEVLHGIAEVQRRLAQPSIFFTPNCVNTIWEMEHYAWDDWQNRQEDRKDKKEKPIKKKDHTCDCIRYVLISRPRYSFLRDGETIKKVGKSSVTGY